MFIEARDAGAGAVLLRADGEIDMLTVDGFRDALHRAIAGTDVTAVVVDFAGVTFCDSAGVRALDTAYAAALERRVGFRLTNVRASVRRVLQLVGVWDALTGNSGASDR